jgi:hypothetical protein
MKTLWMCVLLVALVIRPILYDRTCPEVAR